MYAIRSYYNYYLHIKAVDSKGNTTVVNDGDDLSFDNENLDVILNVDSTNVAKSHTVGIVINKSSIVKREYKWTNSVEEPTTGWKDLTVSSLTLDGYNGDWYLHVRITDAAGRIRNNFV